MPSAVPIAASHPAAHRRGDDGYRAWRSRSTPPVNRQCSPGPCPGPPAAAVAPRHRLLKAEYMSRAPIDVVHHAELQLVWLSADLLQELMARNTRVSSNRICSGIQGRKDLGLTMLHSPAQNLLQSLQSGHIQDGLRRGREMNLCATGSQAALHLGMGGHRALAPRLLVAQVCTHCSCTRAAADRSL